MTAAAGNGPLLDPDQVVLFAHGLSHSTRFKRGEIERLGLARVALEQVRGDPEGSATRALQLLANRSDHYAIHLDVDVVDFTDAPLSEHPSRNTGLKLDQMLRGAQGPGLGPGSGRDHPRRSQSPQRRGRRRVAGALRGRTC